MQQDPHRLQIVQSKQQADQVQAAQHQLATIQFQFIQQETAAQATQVDGAEHVMTIITLQYAAEYIKTYTSMITAVTLMEMVHILQEITTMQMDHTMQLITYMGMEATWQQVTITQTDPMMSMQQT